MRRIEYIVPNERAGQEVKRVVRQCLGISHRELSRLKNSGGLRVTPLGAEPRSVYANYKVVAGDIVAIEVGDESGQRIVPVRGDVPILYEDGDILIVDKPGGVPAQYSESNRPGECYTNTLANYMAYHNIEAGGDGDAFVFRPVNRLDKGTSGLMAVAKHSHAHSRMQKQLHTPEFVREYQAVCVGHIADQRGTISLPIAKCECSSIKREIRADGKPSITRYEVERRTALRDGTPLTLLRIRLETGRTHQIRVHLMALGHPIFGDFLYGTEDARLPGRFALHSCHIECLQPVTAARISLDCALPSGIRVLLDGTF